MNEMIQHSWMSKVVSKVNKTMYQNNEVCCAIYFSLSSQFLCLCHYILYVHTMFMTGCLVPAFKCSVSLSRNFAPT